VNEKPQFMKSVQLRHW